MRDTLILTAHAADQHLEALSTIRTCGRVRVADILSLSVLAPLRESRRGPWHGGEVDTSLMLHLAPELVDLHTSCRHSLPAIRGKGGPVLRGDPRNPRKRADAGGDRQSHCNK